VPWVQEPLLEQDPATGPRRAAATKEAPNGAVDLADLNP
jgi:hypothetical protein